MKKFLTIFVVTAMAVSLVCAQGTGGSTDKTKHAAKTPTKPKIVGHPRTMPKPSRAPSKPMMSKGKGKSHGHHKGGKKSKKGSGTTTPPPK